jgi:hydrogenase nickel incorporation protein HypA/HybF
MHEYSLVQALLNCVEKEAQAHAALGVQRVVVRVGRMGGVEPSLLATAFAMSRTGTLCEHAELELRIEDVKWQCDVCGIEIAPGRALACPSCGWPARLARGDALVLEHLELEVPSHV